MAKPRIPDSYSALDPTRAAALISVIDLQAAWDARRRAPAGMGREAVGRLQDIQRLYEEYQSRKARYVVAYHSDHVPDISPGGPSRLVWWCRSVRAILVRAGDVPCPSAAVDRAYHLCDRIAVLGECEPLVRADPYTAVEAVLQLDAVIRWCEDRIAAEI